VRLPRRLCDAAVLMYCAQVVWEGPIFSELRSLPLLQRGCAIRLPIGRWRTTFVKGIL